jgi:hypothetical protein
MAEASFPRFDGAVVWRSLRQDEQDLIGAVALELAVVLHGFDRLEEPHAGLGLRAGPFGRAAAESTKRLTALLGQNVEDAIGTETMLDETGFPRLPSLLGQVCRVCGCSQNDACQPFSCAWVEPDLCSACGPSAKEGRRDG